MNEGVQSYDTMWDGEICCCCIWFVFYFFIHYYSIVRHHKIQQFIESYIKFSRIFSSSCLLLSCKKYKKKIGRFSGLCVYVVWLYACICMLFLAKLLFFFFLINAGVSLIRRMDVMIWQLTLTFTHLQYTKCLEL